MATNTRNNVLVVGGSSGVGLAAAKLSLSHLPGAQVIISSTNEDKCKRAVAEIKATGHAKGAIVDYVVGDVGQFDHQHQNVEAVLQAAVDRFGSKIDHIVWTAGSRPVPSSQEVPDNSDIIAASSTRLFGPLTLATLAKRYMNDRRQSSITITSGVLGYRPRPAMARSLGLAGGIESATRAMAVELAPIRVNFVVLGAIKTPLLDNMTRGNEQVEKSLADSSLLKSIGTADEAAEAYLYAMRASFTTGTRIDVDGGFLVN